MRAIHTSPRRRPTARSGLPVALATTLGLLLAGCAPTPDGAEPVPGSAPQATAPEPDATSSGAAHADALRAERERAAQKAAAQEEAAERKAAAEAAEKKAAEQAAAEEAAKKKAAEERKAAEAEKRAAEEAAAAQAAEEARQQEEQERLDAMLQAGDTGERVVALQQRLADLGYFLQEVDGDFGPATVQAVWALQKAAGLYRDGVIGPQTQAALDAGTRPSARTPSGRAVEIDLDRQLLMTVENGQVTRVINASSGNGEPYEAKGRTYRATTPRGSFAVYMERNENHESTLELGSMWRPKYFHGAYAVHGSPSVPPYPASHGCVRVSNAAMNWLWDSWGLSKGTPVVLY